MDKAAAIKKTLVWIDDGRIEPVDTIEHDKKLWLVPVWLDMPALRRKRPQRAIRLDSLPYEKGSDHPKADFVLNETLPKSLFDPSPWDKQETRFEVMDGSSRSLLKLVQQAPLVESYAARFLLATSLLPSNAC